MFFFQLKDYIYQDSIHGQILQHFVSQKTSITAVTDEWVTSNNVK